MAQINTCCLFLIISMISGGYSAYIPLPVYTYHHGDVSSYPSPHHTPAITSTSSNILRTPGNLGQISTYHKSIDTPFSSVRKSDVRVSNDALTYATYPASGALHVASPVHLPAHPVHAVHAPVAIAYSAAPAVAHLTFDGFGTHYAW
ncbi:cuticle protein 67-like [Planococcus citri]|uniref:cuticle protein 67-like n=1 Tax=Planococcus citri TaxID=170843 RepID=UPI0031FA11B2